MKHSISLKTAQISLNSPESDGLFTPTSETWFTFFWRLKSLMYKRARAIRNAAYIALTADFARTTSKEAVDERCPY